MRCNCESYTCRNVHRSSHCPNKTDESSPKMILAGKICKECATRISDNDGANLINWDKS